MLDRVRSTVSSIKQAINTPVSRFGYFAFKEKMINCFIILTKNACIILYRPQKVFDFQWNFGFPAIFMSCSRFDLSLLLIRRFNREHARTCPLPPYVVHRIHLIQSKDIIFNIFPLLPWEAWDPPSKLQITISDFTVIHWDVLSPSHNKCTSRTSRS